MAARKKAYFKFSTGPANAYLELDQVAGEVLALRKECDQFFELASIFEFAQVRMLGGFWWNSGSITYS